VFNPSESVAVRGPCKLPGIHQEKLHLLAIASDGIMIR
jgi:hypothetical protein